MALPLPADFPDPPRPPQPPPAAALADPTVLVKHLSAIYQHQVAVAAWNARLLAALK